MTIDQICDALETLAVWYQMPDDHREVIDEAIKLLGKLPALDHDLRERVPTSDVKEILDSYLGGHDGREDSPGG